MAASLQAAKRNDASKLRVNPVMEYSRPCYCEGYRQGTRSERCDWNCEMILIGRIDVGVTAFLMEGTNECKAGRSFQAG